MSANPAYSVDKTRHPIIEIRWHRDATSQDVQAYFRDLEGILAEKRQVTLLIAVPPHLRFNPEERLLMSRWLSHNAAAVAQFILGACFVTTSALIGMALRAVFMFSPPGHPWQVTGSEIDAAKWCRSTQLGHAAALAS